MLILPALFVLFIIINNPPGSQVNIPETPPLAGNQDDVEIASNLDTPWSVVILPNGHLLLTLRHGSVVTVNPDSGQKIEIGRIEGVLEIGEGGLLGADLHPEFTQNNRIYFYHTYRNQGDNLYNRVVSYVLENEQLSQPQIIISDIPGASNHNGGRIKFGPDGYLYITTGDAANPSLSQDTSSLAGKILRLTPEGTPAPNNPFNNEVYSYGHRNPQGLTWDFQGRLWSTEHGPSARDELNLIEAGRNYGWPNISGGQSEQEMETPVIHSSNNTWAPSGLTFLNNSLYFTGLRGQSVYKYDLSSESLTSVFSGQYGRIRDIIVFNQNLLFITNNTDGRGQPQIDDDKIFMISPF